MYIFSKTPLNYLIFLTDARSLLKNPVFPVSGLKLAEAQDYTGMSQNSPKPMDIKYGTQYTMLEQLDTLHK